MAAAGRNEPAKGEPHSFHRTDKAKGFETFRLFLLNYNDRLEPGTARRYA
jgi:hypothetical protein